LFSYGYIFAERDGRADWIGYDLWECGGRAGDGSVGGSGDDGGGDCIDADFGYISATTVGTESAAQNITISNTGG
jgi:hypothetical protein